MSTYLITGTNKGIGFEFVKQLGAKTENTIIATVRKGADLSDLEALKYPNIKLLYIDMLDSLQKFVEVFSELEALTPHGIDFVIHNAGFGSVETMFPLQEQSDEMFGKYFQINTVGTVKLYQAIYPRLEKNGKPTTIVFISSVAGVISTMQFSSGGYGVSKAGVNYLCKELSLERKEKGDIVVAVHPGMVDTDLAAPLKEFEFFKPISPEESVSSMLKVIGGLKIEDSGKLFSYGGEEMSY